MEKCIIKKMKENGMECPVFEQPNDCCWYDMEHKCKAIKKM
jgi:hypothetical protein